MKTNRLFALTTFICCISTFLSCTKEVDVPTNAPKLILKFVFDTTQPRLNNIGQPAPVPAGNWGQSPAFRGMSAHYIELAPGALIALGKGVVLYRAAETSAGGSSAIDFEQARVAGHNETFFELPLNAIAAGSYEWLRVSLAYQNFDVRYYVDTTISGHVVKQEFNGTVASFIGFNNYIKTFKVNTQPLAVNAAKKQGFWVFLKQISHQAGIPFRYFYPDKALKELPLW